LLQGVVISFEGCYLSSKGRQIYASEIYNLIFSPVFIRYSSEFIPEINRKGCRSSGKWCIFEPL